MAGYDWALLADRGGESIESFLATLLNRRYPNARQVNPSQGDGGVDIVLETSAGAEVWQVKKFTSPLSASQWKQVRGSWSRFVQEWPTDKIPVSRYHLVTPWTPTAERYDGFRKLTAEAEFPSQWDGEAFVNGLADQFRETTERFVYGPGAFERHIQSKAILAASPVENSDELSMSAALAVRQVALDQLRDGLSDYYYIDQGTRTSSSTEAPPLPPPDDRAVFHRMTYLGEQRWRTETVVPRNEQSLKADPVSLNVEFVVAADSPEAQAVKEWEEWGTPFKDIPARTRVIGGPLADEEPKSSKLSVAHFEADLPDLFLTSRRQDELTCRLRLDDVLRTQGSQTGWLRIRGATPARALSVDIRIKRTEAASVTFSAGDARGVSPEVLLRELDELSEIKRDNRVQVELPTGSAVSSLTGVSLPAGLEVYHRRVAAALAAIQGHTSQRLLMPNVLDASKAEIDRLVYFAEIYGGTPAESEWTTGEWGVPDDPEEAKTLLQTVIPALIAGTHNIYPLERPTIRLGAETYLIDHPVVIVRHSFRLPPDFDLGMVQPGGSVPILPGEDRRITVSAVQDWTPGSIDFPGDDPH